MESRKLTDSSEHGRHHAQNISYKAIYKQMQLEFVADAGQDVQPLDVVKSKARHCELGQIAPMGLTFCAREWQLLK